MQRPKLLIWLVLIVGCGRAAVEQPPVKQAPGEGAAKPRAVDGISVLVARKDIDALDVVATDNLALLETRQVDRAAVPVGYVPANVIHEMIFVRKVPAGQILTQDDLDHRRTWQLDCDRADFPAGLARGARVNVQVEAGVERRPILEDVLVLNVVLNSGPRACKVTLAVTSEQSLKLAKLTGPAKVRWLISKAG